MEWIQDLISALLGSNIVWGSVIVLVLAKVIPNTTLKKFWRGVGVAITLGMSKRKWWKKFELWFIDGIAVSATALIEGLRSDN